MPNRIIRESALTSASLHELTADEERLWWRLTVVADDFGRFDADPAVVASRCFPRWRTLKAARVGRWLQGLAHAGERWQDGIRLYQVEGAWFGVFVRWPKYQQVRAKASKHPEPPPFQQVQADASGCLQTPANALVFEIENRESRTNTRIESARDLPPLAVLWNDALKTPAVLRVTGQRAVHLKARLETCPDLAWWQTVLDRMALSPFLRGKNDRGWVATFDWLVHNDENAVKVLEGQYDDRVPAESSYRPPIDARPIEREKPPLGPEGEAAAKKALEQLRDGKGVDVSSVAERMAVR